MKPENSGGCRVFHTVKAISMGWAVLMLVSMVVGGTYVPFSSCERHRACEPAPIYIDGEMEAVGEGQNLCGGSDATLGSSESRPVSIRSN